MNWGNVTLNNGETVLIRCEEDLLFLINIRLSSEIDEKLAKYFEDVNDEIESLYDESDSLREQIELLEDKDE